jgi:hypothetical protein
LWPDTFWGKLASFSLLASYLKVTRTKYQIKNNEMNGTGACKGEMRNPYTILVVKPSEKSFSGDLGVDSRII